MISRELMRSIVYIYLQITTTSADEISTKKLDLTLVRCTEHMLCIVLAFNYICAIGNKFIQEAPLDFHTNHVCLQHLHT